MRSETTAVAEINHNVLYWNPAATAPLRRIIEDELPPGWTLTVAGQDGSESELLGRCDLMVVADRAVTSQVLSMAPRLRMIQHQGVGYERIDLKVCRERGIPVALTPEGTTTGVAEHTVLLILAVYKQMVRAANGVGNGAWMQWELRSTSYELSGKTVGLVGFGRIGRVVARRILAFDAKVAFFDPLMVASPADSELERVNSLDELLSISDVVSLHLPGTSQNHHLINERTLKLMRSGAILINTSRGNLVDEWALAAALREKRLAGAGLDVLEQEPPKPDSPLLCFENVIITPHIAAGTVDAFRTKMRAVVDNLRQFTCGGCPRNVVPELSELVKG